MVIELNGTKYEIPQCFEELKTRHYCRIYSEWDVDKEEADRDYFKLFCILTDTDFKSFVGTNENEAAIWNAIAWIINQTFKFSEELPKALKVGDRLIGIHKKVEYKSIGQNIILRQQIAKMPNLQSGISIATAIYLQPEWSDSKFDLDKAMELKEVIDEMPARLIYPIGFFLLRNALSYGKSTPNEPSQTRISRIMNWLNKRLRWQTSRNLSHTMTFRS